MLNSYALLFVDCQSTGASPQTSSLLELAVNGQSWVLRQDEAVSPKILRLIGISSEEIAIGKSADEVFADFTQLIDDAREGFGEKIFAVAHFARLEQSYLDRLWQNFAQTNFPLPLICTHKLAKILHPRLPNYGLRALGGWFGKPLDDGKRAAHHVDATRCIWNALSVELDRRGIGTLDDLIKFMEQKPARASGRREFLITRERRLGLPSDPGVYRYLDRNGKILYVGKATSLKSRVNSYFTGGCRGDHRKLEMLAQAVEVEVTTTEAPLFAGLLEYDEIRRLKPTYNIAFKGRGRDHLQALQILMVPPTQIVMFEYANIMKEYFYDLEDQNILVDGLKLWRHKRGVSVEDTLSERGLLNLGMPLLKNWIAEERQRRNCREIDVDDATDSEEEDIDGVDDEDNFVWTAEVVVAVCERIVRRATRNYIRSKWLRRIAGATIQLKFTAGRKQKHNTADREATIFPSERYPEVDLRRVGVLVHELRRMESKGDKWQIISPWPMTIPFWI